MASNLKKWKQKSPFFSAIDIRKTIYYFLSSFCASYVYIPNHIDKFLRSTLKISVVAVWYGVSCLYEYWSHVSPRHDFNLLLISNRKYILRETWCCLDCVFFSQHIWEMYLQKVHWQRISFVFLTKCPLAVQFPLLVRHDLTFLQLCLDTHSTPELSFPWKCYCQYKVYKCISKSKSVTTESRSRSVLFQLYVEHSMLSIYPPYF